MTNIVGGNTGNLSQPGSSQDGSLSNSASKNATLDFLSLISVVYQGLESSNGEVSKFEKTDRSLNKTDSKLPLDLTNGEQRLKIFLRTKDGMLVPLRHILLCNMVTTQYS